jgi:hypothetical protein
LATAFDLLCNKYYASRKNIILKKKEFSKLMKKFEEILNNDVPDTDVRDMLMKHLTNVNSTSLNERNRSIFEELGIKLSNFEKESLHSRNISIHGNATEIDWADTIKKSSSFYLVVVRLLFKLLSMPYYIDWSTPAKAVTPVEEPQGGSYNVRSIY